MEYKVESLQLPILLNIIDIPMHSIQGISKWHFANPVKFWRAVPS